MSTQKRSKNSLLACLGDCLFVNNGLFLDELGHVSGDNTMGLLPVIHPRQRGSESFDLRDFSVDAHGNLLQVGVVQ